MLTGRDSQKLPQFKTHPRIHTLSHTHTHSLPPSPTHSLPPSQEEEAKSFLVSMTIEDTIANVSGVHTHMCSGALIGETTVLTTATCLKNIHDRKDVLEMETGVTPRVLVKVYGDSSQEFVLEHSYMHPSALFDLQYDIGVGTLDKPSNATPALLYDGVCLSLPLSLALSLS